MAKYEFTWVDAFTTVPFSGNACAVLFDTDSLSDAQRLTIAAEMNLSETAFVVSSDKADFGARYFTPLEEIPLAGHPTIATIHALVASGRIKRESIPTTVTLELKAGVISIELLSSGSGFKIIMSQKKPTFLSEHDPRRITSLFSLTEADLLPSVPVQTVSTGTPQLMIAVKDKATLKRVQVKPEPYQAYRAISDFFSPHLFCLEGATPNGTTFARHPGFPIEDSFTGSATGNMGAFLWRYGLIKHPKFVAEQGHWMGRPGTADVEVVGPPEDIATVKVGGQAVTLVRGSFEF